MKHPFLLVCLLVFALALSPVFPLGLWLMVSGALLLVSFVAELASEERRGNG